jgi:hypothetical protein
MTSTTIRTTIAAAVVALCVAAPAAHATKNTGAFWHSSAANHAITCENIGTLFDYDVEQADHADKAGDNKARDAHLDNATKDLHMAQAAGCDWAA